MGNTGSEVDAFVESRWARFVGVLREITAGGVAGLTAGVIVAGVGSRLAMRLTSLVAPSTSIGRTTDSGFRVGTVTMGGSLEVLLFLGLGFGLLGGVLLVMVWPWVSGWKAWRPVAVGGFVVAVGSTTAVDPSNIDFFILGSKAFLVALFLSLFFAWAFLAVWFRDLLERRLPTSSRSSTIAYAVVTLVGLPFVGIVPATVLDSSSDVPIMAGVSLMLVGVGTLTLWIARVWSVRGPLVRAARWVGYGGYAGTLAFGLAQATSDAWRIIT